MDEFLKQIIKEAGAVVTDRHGNPWTRGSNDLVMANPVLHPQLITAYKNANQK